VILRPSAAAKTLKKRWEKMIKVDVKKSFILE